MRHLFSWYVMLPATILFSLINGIFVHRVDNEVLYIGTAVIAFAAAVLSIFYGFMIQGDGTAFAKGTKYFAIIMYLLLLIPAISLLSNTYTDSTSLRDSSIQNMRHIFSNVIFAFGYGMLAVIWSFLTVRLIPLRKSIGKSKPSKYPQIEN